MIGLLIESVLSTRFLLPQALAVTLHVKSGRESRSAVRSSSMLRARPLQAPCPTLQWGTTATGSPNERAQHQPPAAAEFTGDFGGPILSTHGLAGKNGSSEITHEPDSFGYLMLAKF